MGENTEIIKEALTDQYDTLLDDPAEDIRSFCDQINRLGYAKNT